MWYLVFFTLWFPVLAQEMVLLGKDENGFTTYQVVTDQARGRVVPNTPIEIAQEPWNLQRVQGSAFPPQEKGEGIDLYVIDTGVDPDHPSFTGRVQAGYDYWAEGAGDCNGHGTHVTGTAAGVGFGFATSALIFPVRVLDCDGKGTLATLGSGVRWVLGTMKQRTRKSIVNMSIQSGLDEVIDAMVQDLFRAGAVVVVAAANFNSDACNYSPAREPLAVTVGATTQDDCKLSTSNYGPCVDVYAPGDDILSAAPGGGTATKRGTSMATPLVAGILAVLWEQFPSLVNSMLVSQLQTQALGDCEGYWQPLTGKPIALLSPPLPPSPSPPPPPPPFCIRIRVNRRRGRFNLRLDNRPVFFTRARRVNITLTAQSLWVNGARLILNPFSNYTIESKRKYWTEPC